MSRKKQLYIKQATEPFKLSRSKLELFQSCPRCFYLDRRLGIAPPPGFPFTLNNAVDSLLKKEFDICREHQQPHPIMKAAQLDAVPFKSELLNAWQDYHRGLSFLIPELNVLVYGAVDDVWVSSTGEHFIVDYKATSSDKEINLDDAWKIGYKRQVEIYQWLLRNNGFKVSNIAYFVYANALKSCFSFNSTLSFNVKLLPYEGNTEWVETNIRSAIDCLGSDTIPTASDKCETCKFVEKIKALDYTQDYNI